MTETVTERAYRFLDSAITGIAQVKDAGKTFTREHLELIEDVDQMVWELVDLIEEEE